MAKLYRSEQLDDKYRDEMLKILDRKVKNPQHLIHFINFLIDRDELGEVDRWLAELKQVEPQGRSGLELEARLLKARNLDRELHALLKNRVNDIPDQIGLVAAMFDRYGFAKDAEEAYRAFIARNPKELERELALVPLLARQNRTREAVEILKHASSACKPEAVASAALPLFDAPGAGDFLRRQVVAWLSEAIQKSPTAAPLLRPKLASLYWKQGRYAEAEALNRQILATDPDNVESLNNLAWELLLREPTKCKGKHSIW